MASTATAADATATNGTACDAAAARLARVRVEDDTSLGRSYSAKGCTTKGAGAARRKLTTKTLVVEDPVVDSLTMKYTHLSKATTEDVMKYFHNTWDLTDTLFSSFINDSIFFEIPDRLRRRMIFYFGHTGAVYINKLNLAGLTDHVNLRYQRMFETGVDEMSWDDMDEMQDEDFNWPTMQQTIDFRNQCKKAVEDIITAMPQPCDKPVTPESPYWALFMSFEHENIHLETSSVLIRTFPSKVLKCPKNWRYAPNNTKGPEDAPTNELIPVDKQTIIIGKPANFPSFGFDNEYGRKEVEVPAFAASKFLVTNGEFLPFVLDGGYREKKWWVAPNGDDEGWRWRSYRNALHPHFWVATAEMPEYIGGKDGHPYGTDDGMPTAGTGKQFRYRAQFDVIDMPWDWPVDTNYHEARAFLNWKGAKDGKTYRLPTEAEWQAMRAEDDSFEAALADPTIDPIMRDTCPGNTNFLYGSSCSVTAFPASPAGFYDVYGNVWDWVEDHFGPLPGFAAHFIYDDFSSPCFDGWHTMIKGGSWISRGDECSKFARYAFRRHFFQHAGFRYVDITGRTEAYPGCETVQNLWEGHGSLSSDITTQYADKKEVIKSTAPELSLSAGLDYPKNIASVMSEAVGADKAKASKVLHLGCGVGGVTMELCRYFDDVTALDNDEPSIRHARILQHHGNLKYERQTEGILTEEAVVAISPSIPRSKAFYVLGDATDLPPSLRALAPFQAILVDGLLESLTQPLHLLSSLVSLLPPQGILVISCSNDWNAERTPRNSWLGGFKMNGEDMSTVTMLGYSLKSGFDLVEVKDVCRSKRKTARKVEFSVMEVSVWRRKGETQEETKAEETAGGAGAGAGAAE